MDLHDVHPAAPALARVSWLLGQQLDDGSWNCESIRSGSRHGSLHTTISALDALLVHQQTDGTVPVGDALRGGQEFLLKHSMYRSHRTGRVVDASLTRFPFPPQWHYDVLRGLEHFRATGAARAEITARPVPSRGRRCAARGRR